MIKNRYVVEIVFLVFAFLLANIRSFIFWSLYPPTDTISGPAWREILLWLLALGLMMYLIIKQNLITDYLRAWRQQPLLIAFIVFSFASIFWSNMWTVTLHRSLVFAFATAAAVYLGVRYSIKNFLYVLIFLGLVLMAASYVLIFATPALGTSPGFPYYGAWRGIFWHKNQLGNIIALFNFVSLFWCFSSSIRNKPRERVAAVILYILSLIIVFYAKSVSGYILVFIIHFTFVTALSWLKLRHLMRPIHYYLILFVFFTGAAGVLLNLDFVLGLFNRTPTFTGRLPMWMILLRDVFTQKPWLGYGFGTIWADEKFRYYMSDLVGWPYPVLIGDNGFLDILLNLGVFGFAVFLLNYMKAWVNSFLYFQQELTLLGIYPFIFMIYTFFANLTFSLFMETEVLIWMFIVALMVITTHKKMNFMGVAGAKEMS